VDKVTLTWSAVSGASSGYVIKRAPSHGGPYSTVTRGVTTTTYTDTVAGGVTYYYVVDSANPTGQSTDSNEAPATPRKAVIPTAPTGLVATPYSSTQVDLTWNNTATDAVLVRVERSTDNINYTTVATPNGTTKASPVFNLLPSTTYYFRVRTENLDGVSAWSNVATAKTKS
jgi:cellulose 1,4-beta-cellobiosidase